jgi:hypothetical protein
VTKLRISAVNPSIGSEELAASIVSATDLTAPEARAFADWVTTQTPPTHGSSAAAELMVKLAAVLESHGFTVEAYS